MFNKIFEIFKDPNNPNFWQAILAIVSLAIVIKEVIIGIRKSRISKTSRILLKTIVEEYLEWVKVESKTQKVTNESIEIWVSKKGGGVKTGRTYLIFKKFYSELIKLGYKNLILPDPKTYNTWVNKFDGSLKWSRVEW